MPETRILNEAEKLEEIEQSKDMQKTLANQIGVEPRKLLSHVLDYRFYVEDGKIVNM